MYKFLAFFFLSTMEIAKNQELTNLLHRKLALLEAIMLSTIGGGFKNTTKEDKLLASNLANASAH